jgi:hypothetical protein
MSGNAHDRHKVYNFYPWYHIVFVCEIMVNDNYVSNAVHTWQYSALSGSLIMLTKQVGPSSNDSDLYLTATHLDSQLGY